MRVSLQDVSHQQALWARVSGVPVTHTRDTTDSIDARRIPGMPRSTASARGAPDAYEYGTIANVPRSGRYKVFTNPFAGRPMVVAQHQHSGQGTHVLYLAGTPNLGSFKIRSLTIPTGGSLTAHYIAFGPR